MGLFSALTFRKPFASLDVQDVSLWDFFMVVLGFAWLSSFALPHKKRGASDSDAPKIELRQILPQSLPQLDPDGG